MRVALLLHDDVVAVEDARVDHGLPAHAQDEGARVTDDRGGEGERLLDVLLREDGRPGRDAPDERQRDEVAVDILGDARPTAAPISRTEGG